MAGVLVGTEWIEVEETAETILRMLECKNASAQDYPMRNYIKLTVPASSDDVPRRSLRVGVVAINAVASTEVDNFEDEDDF